VPTAANSKDHTQRCATDADGGKGDANSANSADFACDFQHGQYMSNKRQLGTMDQLVIEAISLKLIIILVFKYTYI
jgi:hypothetical protein